MNVGIVVFEDVEELDFVGPLEVLGMSAKLGGGEKLQVIAERAEPVRGAKGMRVVPDATFDEVRALDVIVVPGGMGTRAQAENPALLEFLRRVAPGAAWVTSVCTGSLLLHVAGLTEGHKVATHWSFIDALEGKGADVVAENVRFVRSGKLLTSAGVSAGIDMALWLVGQLHSPEFARNVQRAMQYDPAPPYTAEV